MAQRFNTPITIDGAASAASQAVASKVDGDTQNRLQIDAGGKLTWGDGSSAGDTNLYRSAADALKTDDTLEAASGLITLTTSGAPTASLSDGALAIDTTNDEFYIRSGGAWVKQGGGGATQSDTAPSNPVAGDLWYETDTGAMYVYYDSAWIEVGTAGVIAMSTTSTPPSSPGNGDLWFDIDTARTYVYYDDGSSQQWIEVGAASAAASGVDGAVQFASGGTFSSDDANLHWDDTNNRLGIGTTSPDDKLHVEFTSGSAAGIVLTNSGNTVGKQGMRIGFDNDRLTIQRASDSGAWEANYVSVDQDTGNVGINDTTPSYKLDVNGDGRFTGSFYLTGIASVPVGEWQSYTPGVSTNSSVGNGSTTGYYMRVGNIIHAYARFDLGSTSTWDSRFGRISAPVTAKNSGSTSTQDNANIVQVEVNDTSASLTYIMGGFLYDTGANFRISGWRAIDATSGSGIRSGYFLDLSNDVTLADGDSITIKAIYMADD